jgi:hypothetical protein
VTDLFRVSVLEDVMTTPPEEVEVPSDPDQERRRQQGQREEIRSLFRAAQQTNMKSWQIRKCRDPCITTRRRMALWAFLIAIPRGHLTFDT